MNQIRFLPWPWNTQIRPAQSGAPRPFSTGAIQCTLNITMLTFFRVALMSLKLMATPQIVLYKVRWGMVGRINGEFVRPGGWIPVWYVYSSLNRAELLAYYRAADIALITPLKDGMNLVAKEYCASSVEADSVFILSEFAGAAVQLHRGALLVNPYDIEAVADEIKRACEMDLAERRARMRRLRRSIREHDIFWWVDSFMHAAFTRDLYSFPLSPEYVADPQQYQLPA